MPKNISAQQIDAILPQTQCGLCGYGGCMPYAEALVNQDVEINLCPPGGVKGLQAIAALLEKDFLHFVDDMRKKEKPQLLAVIREAECIGCTKCIQACPVDAILGSAKQMHSVIATECTGCELCIAPCPVDCIDLVMVNDNVDIEKEKSDLARNRFHARQARLVKPNISSGNNVQIRNKSSEDKKTLIQEALLRAKSKKAFNIE